MAEFEDKLNAILSDPDTLGQIVSIARALTGEGAEPAGETSSAPPPQSLPASGDAPAQPDLSALLNLLSGQNSGTDNPLSALGNLDPKLIQAAMTLFAEYSAADDKKIALITALKPFVKPELYAKVDQAVQIARLSRVIRVAFRLFQKNTEEGSADV